MDTSESAPLRVLVVEDYPDTRRTLRLLLRSWGHDVREAADGPEALRVAAAFGPEVALLDLALPRLDGLEVARRLQEIGQSPRPLLVAVTALTDPAHVREALAAGFDHFFGKPCEPAQLESLLRAYHRARQGMAALA